MKIIGIVSGKGGVGKTTVAANLALSLKEFGKRVTIIDCNLTTPHLTHYLGAYEYPLYLNDVLRGKAVMSSVSYYHNGIFIIPSSPEIKDMIDVDIGELKNSLKSLEGMADIILLDSAPSFGREALSVLQASDEVILVTAPLLPAVDDLIRCSRIIEKLDLRILGIVLNMVRGEDHELKRNEIESMTGIPVIASIPFEKEVLIGLSKRMPIIQYRPDSVASKECMRLAANLLGTKFLKKKSIFSSFYTSFKRLFGLREASTQEIRRELDFKTDADRLLDIINEEGSVKISELSKRIGLSNEEIKNMAMILKDHDLIEYYTPIFGEDRLEKK